MRKTQMALAAVALVASSAAMANGVKVYGALDAGVISGKSATADGGTHFTQGEWSGNIWGLTGSEDLGGGLKAGFTLEGGLSTANGNISNGGGSFGTFNRQSFVSLGGEFGTVALGRQFSPQVGAILSNFPLTSAAFHVPMLEFAGALNGQNGTEPNTATSGAYQAAGGFFIANAVSYTTPSISGISATVMNARPDQAGKGEGTLASASGSFGGVNVNASHHDYRASSSGYSIGANTAIAGLKVGVNYINTKATSTQTAVATTTVGVSYPVTEALAVGVNYAVNDATTKASLMNINLGYSLSKSTSLYAFYNDANAGSYSSYSSFQRGGARAGTQYGAGLAVNF